MNQTTEEISTSDYTAFKTFLENACGIVVGDDKQHLLAGRLSKILEQHNIGGVAELVQRMAKPDGAALQESVIEAMTINETLWFRDTTPFDILRTMVLPEFQKKHGVRPLRMWSAACSSGQEPYSLSMTIEEFKSTHATSGLAGAQIIATDISESILASARHGEYEALAMGRGLSKERLERFFDEKAKNKWIVKPAIRTRVMFQPLNLMESYAPLGKFDVIFCRNVLIYFSSTRKLDILRRLYERLNPGGYLFLGSTETVGGLHDRYQMIQCNPGIVYRAIVSK